MSSEEVVSNTEFLESRFATSSTFKETQSHHQFIPNASSLSLTMKKTTFTTHSNKVSLTKYGSSKVQMTIENIMLGTFYACQYDNDWYFCVANYVSSEHGDVNMKFLYPNPVDTGRKLNVHKTLRRRPGRLLNILCAFHLRPVSVGKGSLGTLFWPQRDNVCLGSNQGCLLWSWCIFNWQYWTVLLFWEKINRKCWKRFQLRSAPLLLIIISIHIFSLVYSHFFILKSVQHYVRAFWFWRC